MTIKFKVKNPGKKRLDRENTYLLAWTTTPWTLPSNTALAVNEEVDYILAENIKVKPWYIIMAKNKTSESAYINEYKNIKEFKGKNIIGLEYEPLYEIPAVKSLGKKSHHVVSADFVNTEDGTGIVHIAPMHGEDDYNVGVQYDLPIIPLLDASGHFNKDAPEFIQGFYLKKGEKYIKEDLEKGD